MRKYCYVLLVFMLFGCAAMSTTVHFDTAIPLDSVVIARFSFEYGGIVRHVDEDDEEDSSQIGGIIPGIVSAVNWISEMNQLSLIQAEMSDASRENWKKRLDEMYEAFESRLFYDLNLPVMSSEDVGRTVMRNDWGMPSEKDGLEYAGRSGCSAVVIADAELTFEETEPFPFIGFLFKPRYHPVVRLRVAMYDSTGTLYWRNTSYARGRRASKINANWFFSSEPFDTNWPSTPSQLFVDALEVLITDTLENQVSNN